MTPEQILFLDIETCPEFETFADMPEDGQAAFTRKMTRDGVLKYPTIEEAYEKEASFYAEFSQIIAVAVARIKRIEGYIPPPDAYFDMDKMELNVAVLTGSEGKILTTLSKMMSIQSTPEASGIDFVCAHNGLIFDFPFIGRRLLINGMPIPYVMDNRFKKPWESSTLDTMQIWRFADFKYYTSMIALCYALGVPSPKQLMDGSMVKPYFFQGKIKEIGEYSIEDTIALVQCYLRMMGYRMFFPEQIVRK